MKQAVKKTDERDKLGNTMQQVEEVTDVMRTNMSKILEREGKLGELELRADQLQNDTEQFQKTGVRLKRQYYWENMKMKILIGVCVAAIIIIIIAIIAANVTS